MYYIYILECKDGSLYTGFTNNIEDRIKRHNAGKGAKYTRGRTPVVLRYSEEFEDKSSALKREAQIKKLTKEKKLQLINSK
ncbi:MAG: GIY-YIG nuclease family protein [Anaerovoracaceae bacterium]